MEFLPQIHLQSLENQHFSVSRKQILHTTTHSKIANIFQNWSNLFEENCRFEIAETAPQKRVSIINNKVVGLMVKSALSIPCNSSFCHPVKAN